MFGSLPARPDRTDAEALFLVELLAPGLGTGGAQRMAEALQRAAARLTVAGDHLTWRGGLFVPDQTRCVLLLDADSELAVRQACDVAGLPTATVHQVTPLLTQTRTPVLPGRPEATASGRTSLLGAAGAAPDECPPAL
jgi:hypothetical protein